MSNIFHSLNQQATTTQRQFLTSHMQQALRFLQLSVLELSAAVEEELVDNPLLEQEEEDKNLDSIKLANSGYEGDDISSIIENSLNTEVSLFVYLFEQAKLVFESQEDLTIAKWIIGSLDRHGLLSASVEEIANCTNSSVERVLMVLEKIQRFEPPGIAGQSLQDTLLIQLKNYNKENSIAYKIVKNYYEDLLHNRIVVLAKNFKTTPACIQKIIMEEIASLNLRPGSNFPEGHYRDYDQRIIPDLTVKVEQNICLIEVNNEQIPKVKINNSYANLLNNEEVCDETKQYMKDKLNSGKRLLKNLAERNSTLKRIAEELCTIQINYFKDPEKGGLVPVTMKDMARRLGLHESTIVRAVANKYIKSNLGLLPLRQLFSHAIVSDEGSKVSVQQAKDIIIKLVKEENKKHPLSDMDLADVLNKEGLHCARRTIAKYRSELGIPNSTQRKIF